MPRATRRSLVLLVALGIVLGPALAPALAAPPSTVPARPAPGNLPGRIQQLWDAIVHDDPSLAEDAFFPRGPFLRIKDMADPGSYYDRLHARFAVDIHALHAALPELARAHFEHFELAHRGGYVNVHEEGNRLPYWASRHSRLFYRVDGKLRSLEVRVVIAWQGSWYVIHLSDFHAPSTHR